MPGGRPERIRMNYGHPLARGLVFAGLGELPNSTYFHDSSLYHNNGALTNTATPATTASGWAWDNFLRRWVLHFDGSNDYMATGALGALPVGTGPFTVLEWMKPDSLTGGVPLSMNPYGNGGWNFYWSLSSGKLSFYNYATYVETKTSTSLGLSAWNAVGVVRTTIAQMYLGGAADGSASACTSNFVSPPGLLLGTRWADLSQNFGGSVADVMVWNRAISPSEIAALADPSNYYLSGLILPPKRRLFAAATTTATSSRRRRILCGV